MGTQKSSSPAACQTEDPRIPSNAIINLTPDEETQMRKLKIMEHISRDGVIQHSVDDSEFPYSD